MLDNALRQKYLSIRDQCAITTAADSVFAPFLLNLIGSLRTNFPDHPRIYVFDLGMSVSQRKELAGMSFVSLRNPPATPSFWKLCWTWKPIIWTVPSERYILHLDSGVIVLRSLHLWYLSIRRNGYFALSQGQKLPDIAPKSYLREFLGDTPVEKAEVFAAGVFGFDALSIAGAAIRETARSCEEGRALGWSEGEIHRATDHRDRIVRECKLFRHDQTVLNLALRKHLGTELLVRSQRKYLGVGSPKDHPRQFLWHARRKPSSMLFFQANHSSAHFAFLRNRGEYVARNLYRKLKARLKRGT